MNLYLDDDTADRKLVALLRKAGHFVTIPADEGLTGENDTRHLTCAIRSSLVLVTRNHDDFLDLHVVIRAAKGVHDGILVVRFDNDPNRDMPPHQIVAAIGNLESSSLSLQSQFFILNHWR